jgi:hypothetical protein
MVRERLSRYLLFVKQNISLNLNLKPDINYKFGGKNSVDKDQIITDYSTPEYWSTISQDILMFATS